MCNKLVPKSSSVDKGFVGMDFRVNDLLHNYIHQELDEVRIIGIHGMRGVGKTTVAQAFYDDFCQDFKHRCFLFNVRERFKRDGLVSLQKNLLSSILMDKIDYIEDEYTGAAMIQRSLCKTKVLVVIDDVDRLEQLENLAGSRNWFGPGSRIIITTTDIHLLKAHDVDDTYKATGLNSGDARQLLSLKAFKKSSPPENYLDLCDHILGYAQGLPLALVVLGSFLHGRKPNEWASAIDRLKKTPNRGIMDVLQISFDGLEDIEKEIFLHIACFYKGKDWDRVIQILDYCDLNPVIGLSVLADKSLITTSSNELSMHDLLQEMGWDIVRRESRYEPGKRSRLWSHEDIHNMLEKNEGTKAIRGMVMELPKLEVAHWNPEAFSNLSHLSLLHIRNVDLPKGLTCLSNSLRLLEWPGCPLRSLPQKFEPDKLIELNLCHSNIKHLWKGTKNFKKLKIIKLCHSQNIVETPDLAGILNLESLDLEGCKSLGISNMMETSRIAIPGSNIPEWFSHRSVGCSVSVELPPDWDSSRFMGFALCVVFVLHEHHQVDERDIHQFKTFNATHHLVCCLKFSGRELEVHGRQPAFRFSEEFCQLASDHLWLFYVSRDKYFGTEWWHNSCSQLDFLFKTRGPGLEVKECGVRLIYEQDVQELNQTTTQSSSRMSPYEDILVDFDIPVEGETSGTGSRTCTLEEL